MWARQYTLSIYMYLLCKLSHVAFVYESFNCVYISSLLCDLQYISVNFFFFLKDFIFKKTLFEKFQYLKQEQFNLYIFLYHQIYTLLRVFFIIIKISFELIYVLIINSCFGCVLVSIRPPVYHHLYLYHFINFVGSVSKLNAFILI